MKQIIYPNVEITDVRVQGGNEEDEYDYFTISTCLRKEHNGEWYLWNFFKNAKFIPNDEKAKIRFINRFHAEVYNTIVLGKVSEGVVDQFGNPVFVKDEYQKTEAERIAAILGI